MEADENASVVTVSEHLSCGVSDVASTNESVDERAIAQDKCESHAGVIFAHGNDDGENSDDDSHDDGDDDYNGDGDISDVFIEKQISGISGDFPASYKHERIADSECADTSFHQSSSDQQLVNSDGMIDECLNATSDSGRGSPCTASTDGDASVDKATGICYGTCCLYTLSYHKGPILLLHMS